MSWRNWIRLSWNQVARLRSKGLLFLRGCCSGLKWKQAGRARKRTMDTRHVGFSGTQARQDLKSILKDSVSIQAFHCIDTQASSGEQKLLVSIHGFTCIDTERLKLSQLTCHVLTSGGE